MKVGQRIVEIVIKAKDDASQHIKSLGKSFDDLKTQVPLVGQAFDLIKNPIAVATGALVALSRAAVVAYNETVKLGAGMFDMSQRTDMTVESIARWKYIADQGGSSIEEFEAAFRKLRKTMADAISGDQAAIDTFEQLGVAYRNTDGSMRDLEQTMLDIGQVIRAHGSASIQGAAAQDALGRSSAAMVAILKQERSELESQILLANAYTSNMTTAWATTADAADDAAARAKTASENIKAALMPDLSGVTDWWTDLRLAMFNAKGWVQVQKAEEEAAKLAARSVAISYTDSLYKNMANVGPTENGPDEVEKAWADKVIKLAKDVQDAIAKVPPVSIPAKLDFTDLDDSGTTIGTDEVMLLEDHIDAMGQLRTVQEELLATGTPAVMDADVIAAGDEALKRLIASVDEFSASEEAARAGVESLASGIANLGADMAGAFLQGDISAMKIGSTIRNVVIGAIKDMIAAFVRAKIVMAGLRLLGLPLADGGTIPSRAFGGAVRAANGYAIPDGPRGMDSVLIAGMPGEEVINRSLSRRLDRFISAYEMGATVSPFALAGAGGGGGNVFNFNVGRPVSVLDELDMGRTAATASRKFSEASL